MSKKTIAIILILILGIVGYLKRDLFLSSIPLGQDYQEETLVIALSTPATDLSVKSLNLNNLIRTGNLYQGLVAFDRNLRIIPSLAVSWGNLSPNSWEFKLRKDVVFHDRSDFNAIVAKDALNIAKEDESYDFLRTIESIEAVDDHTLVINTKTPDPLLLSKLTKYRFSRPGYMGTGPYKVREWTEGAVLSLTAFTDYWGRAPSYRNVEYWVIPDKAQRKRDFENAQIDILVAVPRDQALELPREQIKTSYGLEVNFLMFKLDDKLFENRDIREAFLGFFDPDNIEEIGNYFVRQASQFVAPGVFGYNPDIASYEFSDDERQIDLFGNRLEPLILDYVDSYQTLTEYLVRQMREGGFSVKANPIPGSELVDKIKNNESQIYLVGWQAEDGDAGGFLDAFVHSEGIFNNGRFSDPEIDTLVEMARQEMDPKVRLSIIQDVMARVSDKLIGIPLFESSRLYAVKLGILWEPRLDGLVLAAEVE